MSRNRRGLADSKSGDRCDSQSAQNHLDFKTKGSVEVSRRLASRALLTALADHVRREAQKFVEELKTEPSNGGSPRHLKSIGKGGQPGLAA